MTRPNDGTGPSSGGRQQPPLPAVCRAVRGIGGSIVRTFWGKRPADQNPNLCGVCFSFVTNNHGGAEIEISLVFADIRGSTSLAETMPAGEFRALLDRFYNVSADAVFANDGLLDKFVGNQKVATFVPLMTGEQHAIRAVEAARALMKATGYGSAGRAVGSARRRRAHRA